MEGDAVSRTAHRGAGTPRPESTRRTGCLERRAADRRCDWRRAPTGNSHHWPLDVACAWEQGSLTLQHPLPFVRHHPVDFGPDAQRVRPAAAPRPRRGDGRSRAAAAAPTGPDRTSIADAAQHAQQLFPTGWSHRHWRRLELNDQAVGRASPLPAAAPAAAASASSGRPAMRGAPRRLSGRLAGHCRPAGPGSQRIAAARGKPVPGAGTTLSARGGVWRRPAGRPRRAEQPSRHQPPPPHPPPPPLEDATTAVRSPSRDGGAAPWLSVTVSRTVKVPAAWASPAPWRRSSRRRSALTMPPPSTSVHW
jgi:hypothetical protein